MCGWVLNMVFVWFSLVLMMVKCVCYWVMVCWVFWLIWIVINVVVIVSVMVLIVIMRLVRVGEICWLVFVGMVLMIWVCLIGRGDCFLVIVGFVLGCVFFCGVVFEVVVFDNDGVVVGIVDLFKVFGMIDGWLMLFLLNKFEMEGFNGWFSVLYDVVDWVVEGVFVEVCVCVVCDMI